MEWTLVILSVAVGVSSTSANYTFPYSMTELCKSHICRHGYNYDTFYRVNPVDQKLKTGVDFEMHMAILAPNNGHVLLSPVSDPGFDDPVYEIVIGGGVNKFSEIRRNRGRNSKLSVKTIGILSGVEFRAFYIRISDGHLEFGRENDSIPIMSYNDMDPLPVNYFSFATWNGVEGMFLYDCPLKNANETDVTPDSQLVEVKLTEIEKLKMDLLNYRSPYIPPDPEVTVTVGVKVTTTTYNAFESKLDTGLAIVLTWTDNSLAWNPTKFNGTTNLKFRQGEIWKPLFLVQNADSIGALDTRNPEPIYVVHSGEATLHFQTKITTWCHDSTSFLSKWPRDEYKCSIMIGPWATHANIRINIMNSEDDKLKIFSNVDEVIENEWEQINVEQIVNEIPTDPKLESEKLIVMLNIRRKALTYNLVFYTPLLVLLTFLLLSFWTQPLEMSRVRFYAGSIIVMCMGLSYIDYLVPTHTIPSIVVLYVCILFATLLALMVQVLLMHPSMTTVYKSDKLESIVSWKPLRMLCCLPPSKTIKVYESITNEGFMSNADDESTASPARGANIEEMLSDNTTTTEKDDFAEIVDKFMFTVYSITFAVLIALHY